MDKDLKLNLFIESLLSNKLSEDQIKSQMQSFGFKYSSDPKVRWKLLLDQLTISSKELTEIPSKETQI